MKINLHSDIVGAMSLFNDAPSNTLGLLLTMMQKSKNGLWTGYKKELYSAIDMSYGKLNTRLEWLKEHVCIVEVESVSDKRMTSMVITGIVGLSDVAYPLLGVWPESLDMIGVPTSFTGTLVGDTIPVYDMLKSCAGIGRDCCDEEDVVEAMAEAIAKMLFNVSPGLLSLSKRKQLEQYANVLITNKPDVTPEVLRGFPAWWYKRGSGSWSDSKRPQLGHLRNELGAYLEDKEETKEVEDVFGL
jgi:hypothetical protein